MCAVFPEVVTLLLQNLTLSTIIRISVVLQFTTALTHKDSSQISPWNAADHQEDVEDLEAV